MFWLGNKKIIFLLRALNLRPGDNGEISQHAELNIVYDKREC